MSSLSLYTGLLAEAGRDTTHLGLPEGSSEEDYKHAEGINPVCGDRVSWYFKLKDNIISEIRYEVKGCLMNKASASFLARFTQGLTVEKARNIYTEVARTSQASENDTPKGTDAHTSDDLKVKPWLALAQIRDYPARRKCVMMAWDSFFEAMEEETFSI